VNILIVGLGSIAKKHIKAIRALNIKASIYALRSTLSSDIYEGVTNILSIKDINVKPDFIIISNPTYLREKAILESLKLDCPLFIEKPVLSDLKNALQITDLIAEKKIMTYVACNMRFHPGINYIKTYIESTQTEINEVNIYCGSYLPDWRPETEFRKSYSANENMGGGVHLDLIHELDYCVWLFGIPLKVESVKRKVSTLKIDAVDYANFTLSYEKFTVNIILNYYRVDARREIELVCANDTLVVDLLKNRIQSILSGRVMYEAPFKMSDTLESQMHYFIAQLQSKHEPDNNLKMGVQVLKIALHE
jgi:predicted dehydrogenase